MAGKGNVDPRKLAEGQTIDLQKKEDNEKPVGKDEFKSTAEMKGLDADNSVSPEQTQTVETPVGDNATTGDAAPAATTTTDASEVTAPVATTATDAVAATTATPEPADAVETSSDPREFVDGGYVYNDLFVADDEQSFGKAFAAARKHYGGGGHYFQYKGKLYNTNKGGETPTMPALPSLVDPTQFSSATPVTEETTTSEEGTGEGTGEEVNEGQTTETTPDPYEEIKTFRKEQYDKAVEDANKAYENQIGGIDKLLGAVDEKKKNLAALDKDRVRRDNAYRYITGVGDVMSGIANLVGTAYNASNQEQHYNSPALVEKAEAARKERKLEMDKLNARLDEMRARKQALEMSRDTKLSELQGQYVTDIFKTNLQKISDEQAAAVNAAKISNDWQKALLGAETTLQAAEINAAARIQAALIGKKSGNGGDRSNRKRDLSTFYDSSGKPQYLDVSAVTDVGQEVIKAVKANRGQWTEEETRQYEEAVAASKGSVTRPSDGGKALEIFYEDMMTKPYVYEHFLGLTGGRNGSNGRNGGGASASAIDSY